jgi:hypothetical protein
MAYGYDSIRGVVWVSTPIIDWTTHKSDELWDFIEQPWLRNINYELPKVKDNGDE